MKAVLLILATSIVIVSVLVVGIYVLITRYRRSEYSDWKIGDDICLTGYKDLIGVLGWSDDGIYICEEDGTTKISWHKFNYNKSAVWRRNYADCEKAMGTAPNFTAGLSTKTTSTKINGKPIELLSEIECQVFLAKALSTEEFEVAALIRKRMEAFR